MSVAYLGLGANLGDREAQLVEALERLAEHVTVEAVSRVYESEPAGYRAQPPFLNLVVRVGTELAPEGLLDVILEVEAAMGRERVFRNAPRVIDIDILLHGDERRSGPGLELPHPRMTRRDFVLRPLAELAPELEHPTAGPICDLLASEALEGRARPFRPGLELARWTGGAATP